MSTFPEALKSWRRSRRFSQLNLAVEAEVSSRHISFLETGRSRPSREMILRLCDALQLPLTARNQMMTLAGFAARYPGRSWKTAEMAPIREAVNHMLQRHEPFPAFAANKVWTVLQMNAPAQALFGLLGLREGDSLLDLMLSDGLSAIVENWPDVAHRMALRLRTESAAQGGVPVLDQAAARLTRVTPPDHAPETPVVPMILRIGDLRLSLFGTVAQFGTPDDLTLDDMKIELFFPTDHATRDGLLALAERPCLT